MTDMPTRRPCIQRRRIETNHFHDEFRRQPWCNRHIWDLNVSQKVAGEQFGSLSQNHRLSCPDTACIIWRKTVDALLLLLWVKVTA